MHAAIVSLTKGRNHCGFTRELIPAVCNTIKITKSDRSHWHFPHSLQDVIVGIKGGSYTVDVKDQRAKGNIWNSGLKDGWKKLHNEELHNLHSLL